MGTWKRICFELNKNFHNEYSVGFIEAALNAVDRSVNDEIEIDNFAGALPLDLIVDAYHSIRR